MSDGPDWASTLAAVKRPLGKSSKNSRLGADQVEEWQKFQQQRTGADVAVALGGVDTGDDFDGWGHVTEWSTGVTDGIQIIQGDVQQVQYAQITLADLANTRRRVPFWVSPNPFEYVSFPRSELGLEAGGKPLYTIPAGTMAFTTVSIDEDTTNNQVRFITDGSAPPAHVYCGLYSVDQTTGDKTLVYDFGDVRGSIDTGSLMYEVALEMTADMLLDGGTIMSVGILPTGGSLKVAGIPRTQIVPTPGIYPQGATELLASQTVLPSTVSDSSLDFTASKRIWCSVGQTLPEFINPITIIIDFSAYPDTTKWSSPSVQNFRSTADTWWTIRNGILVTAGNFYFGPLTYRDAFLCMTKFATDNNFAEFDIKSAWATTETHQSHVFLRSSNTGSESVALVVDQKGTGNATITIQTMTSLTSFSGATVRATGTSSISTGIDDTLRLEAVKDETTGVSTYTGYYNGSPIPGCSWPDTGGAASSGIAWRRGGYGSSEAMYGNIHHRAAGAGVFRCGDLSIA